VLSLSLSLCLSLSVFADTLVIAKLAFENKSQSRHTHLTLPFVFFSLPRRRPSSSPFPCPPTPLPLVLGSINLYSTNHSVAQVSRLPCVPRWLKYHTCSLFSYLNLESALALGWIHAINRASLHLSIRPHALEFGGQLHIFSLLRPTCPSFCRAQLPIPVLDLFCTISLVHPRHSGSSQYRYLVKGCIAIFCAPASSRYIQALKRRQPIDRSASSCL